VCICAFQLIVKNFPNQAKNKKKIYGKEYLVRKNQKFKKKGKGKTLSFFKTILQLFSNRATQKRNKV